MTQSAIASLLRLGCALPFRVSDVDTETIRRTALERIARDLLGFSTLEPRKSDSLDFRECAVWNIAMALEAAYAVGQVSILEASAVHQTLDTQGSVGAV